MLPHQLKHLRVLLRRVLLVISAQLISVLAIHPLEADAEVSIPELSSPVIDSADFLSADQEQLISNRLMILRDSGGPQMQIWTLVSLEGEAIETLSMRAVEKWKLGDSERDDGLLLTIAKAQRRYRFEVGQGLVERISDDTAWNLLKRYLQPSLRNGNVELGLLEIIQAIEQLLNPQDDSSKARVSRMDYDSWLITSLIAFILLIFVVLIGAFIYSLFSRDDHRKGMRGWDGGWVGRRPIGSGGGWGGGGWGGGVSGSWSSGVSGNWGGGGGGFSGDGASGDW